jgi:hypothetical protein
VALSYGHKPNFSGGNSTQLTSKRQLFSPILRVESFGREPLGLLTLRVGRWTGPAAYEYSLRKNESTMKDETGTIERTIGYRVPSG